MSGQGQSTGPDEEPPPSPTVAGVLLQMERNRSEDQRELLEVIALNTSALTGASGSGQGSAPQPRGGLEEFLRTRPLPSLVLRIL